MLACRTAAMAPEICSVAPVRGPVTTTPNSETACRDRSQRLLRQGRACGRQSDDHASGAVSATSCACTAADGARATVHRWCANTAIPAWNADGSFKAMLCAACRCPAHAKTRVTPPYAVGVRGCVLRTWTRRLDARCSSVSSAKLDFRAGWRQLPALTRPTQRTSSARAPVKSILGHTRSYGHKIESMRYYCTLTITHKYS